MTFSRQTGTLLTVGACLMAVLALFVPLPGDRLQGTGITAGGDIQCPLGYTSEDGVSLPADHPPVPGADVSSDQPGESIVEPDPNDKSRLYVNAQVWTGDSKMPWAEAFRVSGGGRIIEVGASSDLRSKSGGYSRVVDLQGAFVCPGFVDSHIHLMMGGLEMQQLDLSGVSSQAEMVSAVAGSVANLPPGSGWVLGHSWNDMRWGGGMPEAAWIDQVSPDVPVYLERWDKHCAVVNSVVLKLAGISAATLDPPGGIIVKGPDGQPTGVFKEAALALVKGLLPKPSREERNAALDKAMDFFLAQGVTSVHDMGRPDFLVGPEPSWLDFEDVLVPAANEGRLRLRVHAALPLSSSDQIVAMGKAMGWTHPDGFLSWGTGKAFSDGSLGSHTALMHEPYLDAATSGTWVTNKTKVGEDILAADREGLQVAIHAIGDRAVDEVLELYAEAAKANGQRQAGWPRHRVEHVQHIAGSATIQNLKRLEAIAVVNPLHFLDDEQVMPARLGAERASHARAYAYKQMLQAGITLSCGSDWPVVPADALGSVFAAVYRKRRGSEGEDTFSPGGVTLEQALLSHIGSADAQYFLGQSQPAPGLIAPGRLGDFVLLSENIISGGRRALDEAKVLQTFVGGECMYGCGE